MLSKIVESKKNEKMKIEKKKYITPALLFVEIDTMQVLALSKENGEQTDDEDQLSNEYQGGWNDIWNAM